MRCHKGRRGIFALQQLLGRGHSRISLKKSNAFIDKYLFVFASLIPYGEILSVHLTTSFIHVTVRTAGDVGHSGD